jgi:hypothetical protein
VMSWVWHLLMDSFWWKCSICQAKDRQEHVN